MANKTFKASRAVVQAGFLMCPERQLDIFYDEMTTFKKRILLGLCALTDPKNPDDEQRIKAGDLLEVIEISKGTYDGKTAFDSRHYRDAFEALRQLFNRSLPIATKTVKRVGRKRVVERSFMVYSVLQGFGVHYIDKAGKTIDLDRVPEEYRQNINVAVEKTANGKPRKRGKKTDVLMDEKAIYALVKLDKKGKPVAGKDRSSDLRLPDGYRFVWSKPIADDLKGRNYGWLAIAREAFPVLKKLAGNETASNLFLLLITDIINLTDDSQTVEKSFDFWTRKLGRQGNRNKIKRDMEKAVQRLKEVGVLEDASDERPRIDSNPDRRVGEYYRWRRAAKWTPKMTLALADQKKVDVEKVDLIEAAPDKGVRGRDIKAAREAAGLTVRAFAKRFRKSPGLWSKIENETIHPKTGQPRPIPEDVRDEVEAFVAEHLGWKDGKTEG